MGQREVRRGDLLIGKTPMGHSSWGRVETVKAGLLQSNGQGGSATAHPLPARVKELDNRKARILVIHVSDAD